MIKMGFFGTYKCDIIAYLARIFNSLDKKVAVIDATKTQILNYCIPRSFKDSFICFRNVDYYTNCFSERFFEDDFLKQYDVVLIDFGFNKNMLGHIKNCTKIYMVCDSTRYNLRMMKKFLPSLNLDKTVVKIFRDTVDGKINSTYLNNFLEVKEFFEVEEEYDFELSYEDYKANVEFQHNDIFKFNKLSKIFNDFLIKTIVNNVECTEKTALKAMKKAKGGG